MGFFAVALGAFGAHGLRGRIDESLLGAFETGARYHLVHAVAILAAAYAVDRWRSRAASVAGLCFAVGILVFAGSLYLLALTGVRALGAITPIGGVALLAGWVALAMAPSTE